MYVLGAAATICSIIAVSIYTSPACTFIADYGYGDYNDYNYNQPCAYRTCK